MAAPIRSTRNDRLFTAPRLSRRDCSPVVARNADARANNRKEQLISCYGADMRLPDLREEIAQCERRGLMDGALR